MICPSAKGEMKHTITDEKLADERKKVDVITKPFSALAGLKQGIMDCCQLESSFLPHRRKWMSSSPVGL